MESKRVLLVIVLTLSCLPIVNGVPFSAVIDIAGKAFDVLQFGLDIVSFMGISGETEVGSDEIVDILNARIDASTTTIITNVVLQSKLDRVDDAVINIHSSLIDTRNVIRASDEKEKGEHIKLFVSRFEEHDVIKHIRFLPELLEFIIPGTTGKLVDLFAYNTRCNMTAVYEFTHFYCELLSDGIALHLLYLNLTTDLQLSKTLEDWHDKASHLKRIFDNQERSCMQKFATYAKEDVEAASDALSLWTNSNYRYPWKTNDVIFLKKYGTFQFLYFQYVKSGDNFFVHRSDKTKIAIFTDKHEPKQLPISLTYVKESFRAAIQGKDDQDAAKNVGIAVRDYLKLVGYHSKELVVFFDDGEDFSPLKVKIDENSAVLQCTLENVQLRFCYESGIECTLDVLNWFKGTKTVVGKMKIFAYVEREEAEEQRFLGTGLGMNNGQLITSQRSYGTGLGTKNCPFTTVFYILISMEVILFYRL